MLKSALSAIGAMLGGGSQIQVVSEKEKNQREKYPKIPNLIHRLTLTLCSFAQTLMIVQILSSLYSIGLHKIPNIQIFIPNALSIVMRLDDKIWLKPLIFFNGWRKLLLLRRIELEEGKLE